MWSASSWCGRDYNSSWCQCECPLNVNNGRRMDNRLCRLARFLYISTLSTHRVESSIAPLSVLVLQKVLQLTEIASKAPDQVRLLAFTLQCSKHGKSMALDGVLAVSSALLVVGALRCRSDCCGLWWRWTGQQIVAFGDKIDDDQPTTNARSSIAIHVWSTRRRSRSWQRRRRCHRCRRLRRLRNPVSGRQCVAVTNRNRPFVSVFVSWRQTMPDLNCDCTPLWRLQPPIERVVSMQRAMAPSAADWIGWSRRSCGHVRFASIAFPSMPLQSNRVRSPSAHSALAQLTERVHGSPPVPSQGSWMPLPYN